MTACVWSGQGIGVKAVSLRYVAQFSIGLQ